MRKCNRAVLIALLIGALLASISQMAGGDGGSWDAYPPPLIIPTLAYPAPSTPWPVTTICIPSSAVVIMPIRTVVPLPTVTPRPGAEAAQWSGHGTGVIVDAHAGTAVLALVKELCEYGGKAQVLCYLY